MKTLPLPPLKLLKEIFTLSDDSPSGLRWKTVPSNRVRPGDIAGHQTRRGYWNVSITTDKRRLYLTHRIVFFMKTGADPFGLCIDHANHDLSDFINLRIATPSENSCNTNKASHRKGQPLTSKFKGVHWDKAKNKWVAQIRHAGKSKFLGRFTDEKEAARAYDKAALNFYGDFALINGL